MFGILHCLNWLLSVPASTVKVEVVSPNYIPYNNNNNHENKVFSSYVECMFHYGNFLQGLQNAHSLYSKALYTYYKLISGLHCIQGLSNGDSLHLSSIYKCRLR